MRAVLAVVAIAVGVAMGFAIHLINAAAFNEFSAAVQSLAGQADVQVRGREALFDEGIYPRLAAHDGVAVASPVLEVDAARCPARAGALKIVGLDALRAGCHLARPDGRAATRPRRRHAGRRRHLPVARRAGLARQARAATPGRCAPARATCRCAWPARSCARAAASAWA